MKYKPRVKIICFILLLTFLLGVISAPLANAYNYQGLHWPGTSTYWAFDDYAPVPTSWQTPIISAATTWNNAGSRFRFIRDEALGGALGYTVRYYPRGQDGYIAMTVRSYNSNNVIVSCYTRFNKSYPWSTSGGAGAYDVQNCATHEFGHWLALEHVSDTEATMYAWIYFAETKKRTLLLDDVNGIKAIYGSQ